MSQNINGKPPEPGAGPYDFLARNYSYGDERLVGWGNRPALPFGIFYHANAQTASVIVGQLNREGVPWVSMHQEAERWRRPVGPDHPPLSHEERVMFVLDYVQRTALPVGRGFMLLTCQGCEVATELSHVLSVQPVLLRPRLVSDAYIYFSNPSIVGAVAHRATILGG